MAREIKLYSGIYSWTAERFMDSLDFESNEDVVVRVNSFGGSVFDGFGMLTKMSEYEGKITVKVDGLAASMATFLLLYADEVQAVDVARLMIHRADGYAGSEEAKNLLNSINKDLRKQYESRIDESKLKSVTGKSFDDIFNPEKRVDVWLTANQARQIGLIDKVVKLKPTQREATAQQMMSFAASAGIENLPEIKIESKKETISQINNNKQMNSLEDLKAEKPEIYKAAVQLGVSSERDRVGAWMAYAEVDQEAVTKGIESGEEITATQREKFNVKMNSQKRVEEIENADGNDKEVDPKGEGKKSEPTAEEKEAEKYEADLKAEIEKYL